MLTEVNEVILLMTGNMSYRGAISQELSMSSSTITSSMRRGRGHFGELTNNTIIAQAATLFTLSHNDSNTI